MLSVGGLFSGVGGFELGLQWAGFAPPTWMVEKDPKCRRWLRRWWPNSYLFDDVCLVGAHELDPVDLICGGFPCQDVSDAGTQEGLEGERSGLWHEFHRIIRELLPRFVLVENVAALRRRGLDVVLGNLASLGYDAEWHSVRASELGAPHHRPRLLIIAWRSVANTNRDGRRRVGTDDEQNNGYTQESCGDNSDGCSATLPNADSSRRDSGRGSRSERTRIAESAHGTCDEQETLANPDSIESKRRGGLGELGCAPGQVEGAQDQRQRTERTVGNRLVTSSLQRLVAIPESGMGNLSHGIPTRVARWPAGPNEAQHEWEPPRTIDHIDSARLRALGNAIVPEEAYLMGMRVKHIASRLGLV